MKNNFRWFNDVNLINVNNIARLFYEDHGDRVYVKCFFLTELINLSDDRWRNIGASRAFKTEADAQEFIDYLSSDCVTEEQHSRFKSYEQF